jgi:hypothetical protein
MFISHNLNRYLNLTLGEEAVLISSQPRMQSAVLHPADGKDYIFAQTAVACVWQPVYSCYRSCYRFRYRYRHLSKKKLFCQSLVLHSFPHEHIRGINEFQIISANRKNPKLSY